MPQVLAWIWITGLTVCSAGGDEVVAPRAKATPEVRHATSAHDPNLGTSAARPAHVVEAEVQADQLDVFDRPDDKGFITGRVQRGDQIRIRADRSAGAGWLAIVPLSTAIFWIEQSSLESDEDPAAIADAVEHDHAKVAWVDQLRALIRSGQPQARLPGPPVGFLPKGTMVQLVDRPPLVVGEGPKKTRWLAIVPPAGQVAYVHAAGIRWVKPTPPVPPAAATRASFERPGPAPASKPGSSTPETPSSWPPGVSAELQRIDGIYQVIVSSQPIEQWRFETVRAGYQDLLKRAQDRLDLEEALRTRLNRLTQYEQAAKAAPMNRSWQRAIAGTARWPRCARTWRTWSVLAPATLTPSVSSNHPAKVDGHKVFALIGGKGSTIAYLDIPPDLEAEPFLARRVGVRGQTHWSEDLGTRLISVRDMESIEAKK